MDEGGKKWLRFLRQYGPIPSNDNMYDEQIQRSARRWGFPPIVFDHPCFGDVLTCIRAGTPVVLTGTAGDGKTHLCRKIWDELGCSKDQWGTDAPYLKTEVTVDGGAILVFHVIRDLSAWVPQIGADWSEDKAQLLRHLSSLALSKTQGEVFLIAANDGQLIETWRRLADIPQIAELGGVFEDLLVEDKKTSPSAHLFLFNLSRVDSAKLLDLALTALLGREEWSLCYSGSSQPDEVFGENCPIRHNLELLKTPLVQQRLRALFRLCDHSNLHIPIRQILLLLSNCLFGHPDAKDRLLCPADVTTIVHAGTVPRASLYSNLFGGNLTERRRESITIFDYLGRFGVGYETSNRVDNILIFGEADDQLREYFRRFMGSDRLYGADDAYRAAQNEYLEGGDEDQDKRNGFLERLVDKRRGLFFKIPEDEESELNLWDLTVFHYAGEYLSKVLGASDRDGRVERPIVSRLVRGLNRIFVGMLVASDRELYLATSSSFSHARVSRLLEEKLSVLPRLGERVEVVLRDGRPHLEVVLAKGISCSLELSLVRFEFISRVAEGALPNSFSKECYEDILAFKSRIMAGLERRRQYLGEQSNVCLTFNILSLDDNGNPVAEPVEVPHVQ